MGLRSGLLDGFQLFVRSSHGYVNFAFRIIIRDRSNNDHFKSKKKVYIYIYTDYRVTNGKLGISPFLLTA